MREKLRQKLDSLIQEEKESEVDQELLTKLFELAAGDPLYDQFGPSERNTLNEFFTEVRNYLLQEVLSGKYGAQVVIDAVIVLAFDTGYKLRGEFGAPPSEAITSPPP